MSYILEALKKAERERDVGAVPNIASEHIEPELAPANHWKLLGIGIAALNVVLLVAVAVILLNDQERADATALNVAPGSASPAEGLATLQPPPPPPQVARAPAPPAPLTPPAPSVDESVSTAPPAPAVQPMQASIESTPDEVPVVPAPVAPETPEQASPTSKSASPETADSMPAQVAMTSKPTAAIPRPPLSEPVQKVEPAPIEPEEAEPEPIIEEIIPSLQELSSDFKQSVPPFEINVHVYADEVQRRFVLMDMKKYREGDRLPNGIFLEEIRPGGLVLDFRGVRFVVEKE